MSAKDRPVAEAFHPGLAFPVSDTAPHFMSETVMPRSLVVSLALFAIVQSRAGAQTCMGLASFGGAPMQLTASGSLTQLSNSFGGTLGYGLPSSVYGNIAVATTSYDVEDGSTLGLAARVGYQLNVGRARPVQVCPNVSFGIGKGPNNDAAGIDQSSRSATIGLHLGTELGAGPRMKVIPSIGFSYAHGTVKAEDSSGTELFEISDRYGLAQIGVGIILNQRISIRPSIEIPVRVDGSDPTVGLTLGYNIGP
jgi:hypothetical protein